MDSTRFKKASLNLSTLNEDSCRPKLYQKHKSLSPKREYKRNSFLIAVKKKDQQLDDDRVHTFSAISESDEASVNSTLGPCEVLPMQIVEVEVTHVDTPSCFYVQKMIEYGKLNLIFEEINILGQTLDPPHISSVVVGSCFLGRFTRDGNYYRAKIISVNGSEDILVRYIDYGNSETLPISRLRPCPKKYNLKSIPAYEIPCCLWGISPCDKDGWSVEATNLFIELVTECKLTMCILSVTPRENSFMCQVNLMSPSSVNHYLSMPIGEVLLYFKYAKATETDTKLEMDTAPGNLTFNIPDVPLNTDPVDVNVSYIESPSHFYVQLLSSSKRFNSTMINIQTRYHSVEIMTSSDWQIYLPKAGMVCCVKARDKRWHRAVVESENGPMEITVQLVDTGEVHVVTYKEMKKLEKKFTHLAAQAIKCKFKDLVPILGDNMWTADSIRMLKTIVECRNVKAIFHNKDKNVYQISLRIDDGTEDITQILVDNNHGYIEKKKSDSFYLATAVELLNIGGLEDSTFASSRRNQLLPGRRGREQALENMRRLSNLGEMLSKCDRTKINQSVKHFVIYLDVTSLSAIHIRFTSQQDKYLQIMNELERIDIAKRQNCDYEPKLGDLCMVILKERKIRARVKILSLSSDSVMGHLVDVGGILTFSKSSLIPLDTRNPLLTHPSLSTVVALADVQPTCGIREWSKTACDFARDVLSCACDLFIVRKGKIYKDPDLYNIKVLPVELGWIHKSNCPFEEKIEFHSSLNEVLIEMGLALPIRNKQMKLAVSEKIMLASAHSEDASKFSKISREDSDSSVYEDSIHGSKPLTCNDDFLKPILKIEPPKMDLVQLIQKAKSYEPPSDAVITGSWQPPQPLTESVFLAKVTNVDMQGCVSLYPVTEEAKLNEMITVHEFEFKKTEPKDSDLCWSIGDPVVARYFQDSKWYRATILELREDKKVNVEFIDYGNTDVVSVKDIRTKVTYINTPIQSYKCIIDGIAPVAPTGWKLEHLDFLHKLIVDKTCRITLTEEYKTGVKPKVMIELYETKTNVSSILIDTKICKSTKKSQALKDLKTSASHASDKTSDVLIEGDVSASEFGEHSSIASLMGGAAPAVSFTSLSSLLPPFPLPSEGDTIPVRVSAIEIDDPSRIFISLMPPTKEEDTPSIGESASNGSCEGLSRASLCRQIHSLYASHKDMLVLVQENISSCPRVVDPVQGTLCLAFFMETKIWHRALILNVEDFEVEVLFIDYGNREKIDRKWLREAPSECFLVPTQCLFVKLNGIHPPKDSDGTWSEEAMREMLECLFHTNKQFYALFISTEDLPEVSLLVEDNTGLSPLSKCHFQDPRYFSFS